MNLKTVPAVVWVCLTLAFLGVVAAFVILAITGSDATNVKSVLNQVANFAVLIVSASGAVYSGVAAKNSQDTKEQTNGQLDARIAQQVANQLIRHGVSNIASSTTELKGVTDDGRPSV